LMGNIVSILNDNENISFVDKNIFIIDDSLISFDYRNDIAHVMFELLNISSFYISSQSMLSLHDNDMTTGVVINYLEKNKIQIVHIHQEKIISVHEMNTSKINIDKIKNKINNLMKDNEYQLEIIENIIYGSNMPESILEKNR